MAVTEQTRHNVHKHFETTMGEELAGTVMELLPGVGWADVARRQDVEDVRKEVECVRGEMKDGFERVREWATERFELLEVSTAERFELLEKSMVTHKELHRHTLALVATTTAVVTIATALGRAF